MDGDSRETRRHRGGNHLELGEHGRDESFDAGAQEWQGRSGGRVVEGRAAVAVVDGRVGVVLEQDGGSRQLGCA